MGENYNITVGRRIKNARKLNNISMKDLGVLVNLHESTISRYEKGDIKSLDIEKIKEFAQALHTTPAYLMGWDDEPDNLEVLKDLLSKNNLTLNDFTKEELSKIVEYSLFLYNQRK